MLSPLMSSQFPCCCYCSLLASSWSSSLAGAMSAATSVVQARCSFWGQVCCCCSCSCSCPQSRVGAGLCPARVALPTATPAPTCVVPGWVVPLVLGLLLVATEAFASPPSALSAVPVSGPGPLPMPREASGPPTLAWPVVLSPVALLLPVWVSPVVPVLEYPTASGTLAWALASAPELPELQVVCSPVWPLVKAPELQSACSLV